MTTFTYLLDARTQFSDSGPNSFADAVPLGSGAIVPDSGFPLFFAYDGDGGGDRLTLPTGIAGDQSTNTWTFQARVRGYDWDALSPIEKGIVIFSRGLDTGSASIVFTTSNTNDNFRLKVAPDTGNSQNVDSTVQAVDGAIHFFSATRVGALVLFHIDGTYIGSTNIGAFATFDFSDKEVTAFTNFFSTSGLDGRVSEIFFVGGQALYGEEDYTPPTAASYTAVTSETALTRSWGFELDGHSFYTVRAGQQGTLIYDLLTQQWSEWVTSGETVWDAVHGVTLWNDLVVCAPQSGGVVYQLDPTDATDEGDLPISCVTTGILKNRERVALRLDEVRLSASVGDPYLDGAAVTLRWSDDQGQSYTAPLTVSVTSGDNSQPIRWRFLGHFDAPLRIFEIADTGAFARINGCDVEVR